MQLIIDGRTNRAMNYFNKKRGMNNLNFLVDVLKVPPVFENT